MTNGAQLPIPTMPMPMRGLVIGLVVAAVGGLLLGLGLWLDPVRARHAYLAGFAGITAVSLGGLSLLMIVHAMDAKWPVVVRRPIEAMVAPLPVLALAFIPLVAWVPDLYSWATPVTAPAPAHVHELLEHKESWLDPLWFSVRTAIYFACWLGIGLWLRNLSHRHDDHHDARFVTHARALSRGAMPLMALTLTFAAFDWVMSLDPLWVSTIFGLYYFGGALGGATAAIILLVAGLDHRERLRPLLHASHYSALGRVLLTATALWGYFAFFQLMLIWIANRPDEVAWYLDRTEGSWIWVAVTLAVLHLVVPLVALLSYRLKRQRRPLATVAVVVLLAHVIDVHWMVMPRTGSPWPVHWIDPAGWLLLGGIAVAWSSWRMAGRAVAPRHDPRLQQGARYRSV